MSAFISTVSCGLLKSRLACILITRWALCAEEWDYCVSTILKELSHPPKKDRIGTKTPMAKPTTGLSYLPKTYTDSKIHTAVAG